MRNLRIKTLALLTSIVTVLSAASVYAYYATVPGIVQVYVTDPPRYSSDVKHIYLTFYKVELHKTQGDAWVQVGGNFFQTIDLMAAIDNSILLASQQVPQGTYDMTRITLTYAKLVLDHNGTASTYLLTLPPELQNGQRVPLQGSLTVKAGSASRIIVDITLSDPDLHRLVMTAAVNAHVADPHA